MKSLDLRKSIHQKINKMNMTLLFFLFGTLIGINGCTLAPQYKRPKTPIASNWPSGAAYPEIQTPVDKPTGSELHWREFFVDENLHQLIETALKNNIDLRLAALNIQRARALYGIQRADLFPSVDTTAGINRHRVPADLSSTGRKMTSEQYSVNLGVTSWEIDFFGRIQSLKDQKLEEYLATEQARRSAQISLISAVAGGYLTLAANRERLKLAKSTLESQTAAYNLIRHRYEIGLASELDLRWAQTQVDTARGDIAHFTQLTAQDQNALNLLTGSFSPMPSDSHPKDLTGVKPPRAISPGMSSEVLLKRPDIMAAEHRLKATHALIGAARAAFFPRIALTTSVGTASSELSGLFKSGSSTWNFAPQIVMPLFDARLRSAYEASKVEKEISLAQYEKAIQTAFREVADVLAVQGTVDSQLAAQQSLMDAVAEAYRLSTARYIKGIDSYLSVLDAQRSLYAAEKGLIAIRLAKLINDVRLYAVLGGGGGDLKGE